MLNWIARLFPAKDEGRAADDAAVRLAHFRRQAESALARRDLAAAAACYEQAVRELPVDAALHCRLAYVKTELGKSAEAVGHLQRALKLDPASPDAYHMLGLAERSAGRTMPAETYFRQALKHAPEFEPAYLELIELLVSSNRGQEAIDLAEAGAELCPRSVELHFRLGYLAYTAGQMDVAGRALVRVTELAPDHAVAFRYLGLLHLAAGRLDQAGVAIEQAMLIDHDAPETLHFLALLQRAQGRLDEAIATRRDILLATPGHVDNLLQLAQLERLRGDLPASAGACRQLLLLVPDDRVALYEYGATLLEQGDANQAKDVFARILAQDRDHLDSLLGLGTAAFQLADHEAALRHFERARALRPDLAYIHFSIGSSHQARWDWESAVAAFRQALLLGGEHADTLTNLGLALLAQEKHDEALAMLERASGLTPNDPKVWINLGFAGHAAGHDEQAVSDYERGIAMGGGNAEVFIDLGSACFNLLRLPEAREYFERALALDPGLIDVRTNLALLFLLQGDMANGWREYEHRLNQSWYVARPEFTGNAWRNDASLAGKSIALFADQGMGDALQFVRYAAQVAGLGATVTLVVHAALQPLLSSFPGMAGVYAQEHQLPSFDYSCPLSSLPYAFGTRLETVPAATPYVHPDQRQVALWKLRLEGAGWGNMPRIGVVWAGNPMFSKDAARSVTLELLAPLFQKTGFCFVLLQKDVRQRDTANMPAGQHIFNAGPALADFSQTAALIANLDLVISVDTAVAHLTGAMNVPLWLMLPFAPDFRWLMEREDSPWYPSAKLFRQAQPRDWRSVVDAMGKALDARFQRPQPF